jgi:hypothetical protein
VALSDGINLLRVGLKVKNTGTSQLILQKGMIQIQQILPVLRCVDGSRCAVKEVNNALENIERTEDIFDWPLISERIILFDKPLEIEPSEEDDLDYEFAVSSDVKVVRIYSYFRNEEKSNMQSEIGWSTSTLFKFEVNETK